MSDNGIIVIRSEEIIENWSSFMQKIIDKTNNDLVILSNKTLSPMVYTYYKNKYEYIISKAKQFSIIKPNDSLDALLLLKQLNNFGDIPTIIGDYMIFSYGPDISKDFLFTSDILSDFNTRDIQVTV